MIGSTLVAGSAIRRTLSGLIVDSLGYRGMFWLLAGIGMVATLMVVALVPETLKRQEAPGFRSIDKEAADRSPDLCAQD